MPRLTTGPEAQLDRRNQKIRLARILFSDGDEEDVNPSEVYSEQDEVDEETLKVRQVRLKTAKESLKMSSVLREAACISLSLSELSKRYLLAQGKEGAEAALRCADKAIEVASDGFYDSDDVAVEVGGGYWY